MYVIETPPDFERSLLIELFRLADDSETELQGYINSGRLFVLREDTTTIGQMLVIKRDEIEIELKSLSIVAALQNKGLGKILIREGLSILAREGIRRALVATSTADIDQIAFYQKVGFRCLTIERDAFTPGNGYQPGLSSDGILVRDRIWLDIYF